MKSSLTAIYVPLLLTALFELSLPNRAYADDPVLDNYLRAKDDLQYQVTSLQKSYSELSKAIEAGRKTAKNTYYLQADRKKSRAEIVQAIFELQKRLQAIDAGSDESKKDTHENDADVAELEARLHEVDLRLAQTRKSLDDVQRLIREAK